MSRPYRVEPLVTRLSRLTVRASSGCLEFTGKLNERGYARVSFQGKRFYLHRLIWETAHGPLPEDQCVLHKCDNPKCCNLEHLFQGTRLDNIRDMHEKGRAGAAKGERQGKAKLTEADVRYLRALPSCDFNANAEAIRLGVHTVTLLSARRGATWRHI